MTEAPERWRPPKARSQRAGAEPRHLRPLPAPGQRRDLHAAPPVEQGLGRQVLRRRSDAAAARAPPRVANIAPTIVQIWLRGAVRALCARAAVARGVRGGSCVGRFRGCGRKPQETQHQLTRFGQPQPQPGRFRHQHRRTRTASSWVWSNSAQYRATPASVDEPSRRISAKCP